MFEDAVINKVREAHSTNIQTLKEVLMKLWVLQNLGKADRTADTAFDEHVVRFLKQQASAIRLQKEIKNYLNCLKAMSLANQSFYEAIKDTYEPDWPGYTRVYQSVESLNLVWEGYQQALTDEVQSPINAYITQFPEIKAKIAKRGRKLVDYDSARHNVESLEQAKKRDELKIQKSQEDLRDCKRIYEELNNELHEELPTLYENRVGIIASHLNSLFSTETKFSEESAKIYTDCVSVSDELAGGRREVNLSHNADSSFSKDVPQVDLSELQAHNDTDHGMLSDCYSTPLTTPLNKTPDMSVDPDSPRPTTNGDMSSNEQLNTQDYEPVEPKEEQGDNDMSLGAVSSTLYTTGNTAAEETEDDPAIPANSEDYSMMEPTDDIYKVPGSNQPVNPGELPEGVLFQVQATHPYAGEDIDELTFDKDEIIFVVPFAEPEEQDEGWLMGYKPSGTKEEAGVFPENFTKRI